MKRFYLILLLCLAVCAGAVLLVLRYAVAPSSMDGGFKEWIGLADPPERVVLKLMSAWRDGESKKIDDLLSERTRIAFYTNRLLNDPAMTHDKALEQMVDEAKTMFAGADFTVNPDPAFPPKNGYTRILVQVKFKEKSDSDFRFPMLVVQEKDGVWRCEPEIR